MKVRSVNFEVVLIFNYNRMTESEFLNVFTLQKVLYYDIDIIIVYFISVV